MELLSGVFPIYLLPKKVIKAIAFQHFTIPSSLIFSDLKILKPYDLLPLKLLTFVYGSFNRLSPPYFHIFTMLSDVHQYDTRLACKGVIFMTQPNTLQYGVRSVS